jgi:hypothetical protein
VNGDFGRETTHGGRRATRDETALPKGPVAGYSVNVEQILAINLVKRAVWVAPPLIAVFWMLRGSDGAAAAAIGVVLVVANFLVFGAMLSVSAKINLSLYHAAALFGFFIRLALISVTVLAIARLVELDRLALGVSLVVTYMVLLSWEAVAVAKGRERELEWIN